MPRPLVQSVDKPEDAPKAVWASFRDEQQIDSGPIDDIKVAEGDIVAIDGSCIHGSKPWARAAWAVVVSDGRSGKPTASVRGTVPGYLPQSAAIAEHYGYIGASL